MKNFVRMCPKGFSTSAGGLELDVDIFPAGPEPFGLTPGTRRTHEMLFVFHYQHAAHLVNFTIGSCKMNVLPRPGPSLSAHARPPCRLATDRTM